MGKSKLGSYMLLGAVIGGVASLLDTSTREQMIGKSKKTLQMVQYYAKNKDDLKQKIEAQKEKYETLYENVSENATYIIEKVGDIKQLVPQVKELATDAKEAFDETKDDYQEIVSKAVGEETTEK